MTSQSSIHRLRIVLLLLAAGASGAGEPARPLDLAAAHKGRPEIDLALLDLAPQPESVRAFFAAARQAFGANPMATFADLPAIRQAAEKHGIPLLGGPLLGGLTDNGARVWLRTVGPAEVEVVVSMDGRDRRFGPTATTAAGDFTAVVPVTGLAPGTRHPYRVLVDGKAVPIPAEAAITTTPAADAKGITRIAFGADFHKTGLWNADLLARIRSRGNIALLLLGDLAVDDRDARVGLHRSDYLLRDLSPAWRSLAAGTAVYATWDDHDYFDNDLSGIPGKFTAADRAAVRAAWHQNWNNPGRDDLSTDRGIFFRTRIGPCDVIMLDTRSLRGKAGEADSFLGAEQMGWLEQELAVCSGPFILLTSGTMWSDNISNGKDSWGVWDPQGRERIFSFIERKRIGGVLLLSGDRHGARVIHIPRPSGFHFREFELGSLGAHPGPPAFGMDKSNQPLGLTGLALFGEFTFDTGGTEPSVTARVIDPHGAEHYSVTLTRSQLTPPAPEPATR